MNPVAKYLAVTAAILGVMLGCAAAGWTIRGWRSDAEMKEYQYAQEEVEQARFEDAMAIQARNEELTDESSQRLDQQQITQQKEIVYVDKQVIKYRDRWRDRDCKLTDDWLQLYNASLFGNDTALPEASAAGSAPSGAGMLLPAGRN
jgi:hypothetical protein